MTIRSQIIYLSSTIFIWYLLSFNALSVIAFSLNYSLGYGLIVAAMFMSFVITALQLIVVNKKFSFALFAFIPLVILFASFAYGISVNNKLYDASFDGQGYHSEAITSLIEGWNPIYQPVTNNLNQYIKDQKSYVWLDGYPKLPWYQSAAIYDLTHDYKDVKFLNFAIIFAAFNMAFLIISSLTFTANKNINSVIAILLSVFILIQPTSLIQSTTASLDGLIYYLQVIFFGILYLIYKEFKDKTPYQYFHYLNLAATIAVIVNVKTAGLVYSIFFLFMFGLYTLLIHFKEFQKILLAGILGLVIGVVALGFNPYLNNIIYHKNILYPVFGNNESALYQNTPSNYRDKGNFEIFVKSIFFKTDNVFLDGEGEPAQLKLPFTWDASELESLKDPELKKGGDGPFFSGGLLIAIVAFILAIAHHYSRILRHNPFFDTKQNSEAIRTIFLVLFVLLSFTLSFILTKTSSTLRYIPHIWIFVTIFLVFALNAKYFWSRLFAWISVIILVINVGFVTIYYFKEQIESSQKSIIAVQNLKDSGDNYEVNFGLSTGTRQLLREQGAFYTYNKNLDEVCPDVGGSYQFIRANQTQICLIKK
jgi:hypothetical protein